MRTDRQIKGFYSTVKVAYEACSVLQLTDFSNSAAAPTDVEERLNMLLQEIDTIVRKVNTGELPAKQRQHVRLTNLH